MNSKNQAPTNRPNNAYCSGLKNLSAVIRKAILLVASVILFAAAGDAQTIQGNFNVVIGPTYTYTFDLGYSTIGVSWVVANGTIISSSASSGSSFSADIQWTTAGTVLLKIKSTRDGILDTETVTITSCSISAPSLNASSFSRCGPGTLTLQATPGSGGSLVTWYSGATGSNAVGTGNSFTTPSQSTSGLSYYVSTKNTTTGCESARVQTPSVTVNSIPAAPTVSISTPAICGPGTVTLTGSTPSGTVVWYTNNTSGTIDDGGPQGATYSPYVSLTTTFYASVYLNGCETPANARNGIGLNVKTIPNAAASNQTICSGQMSSISITNPNGVSGTSFSWTVSQSNVTGGSNSSGSSIAQTLNATSTTAGTATYTITPTANGCTGSSIAATATVNPLPSASGNSQTICSGTSTSISLSSNVSGTSFTWTATPSNGSALSGYANGSGSSISQTLSNSGNANYAVTYTVTPSANGCAGAAISPSATVTPRPVASASNVSICSGANSNINPTTNISGSTLYTWTVVQSNVSGASNSNNYSIGQVLTATTTLPGTATYTVTPSYNGCNGNNFTVAATVNPIPAASASNQTICSNTATSISLSSTVTGTTYSWTVSQSNTSGATNSSGSTIAQTLNVTTTSNGTATYTVTPSANGCPGSPIFPAATVKPLPVASASSQSICSGTATSIGLSSNLSGTTYSWTVSQSNASGASNSSGSSIAQILTATASTNGTVTYTVTPTANSCPGLTIAPVATVKPIPTVSAANQSLFTNTQTSISISNPNSVSGTTFSWTMSQSNASGASNGSGNSIAQTLSTTTSSNGTVTYTITPTASSCTGSSVNAVATVLPSPVLMAPSNRIVLGNIVMDGGAGYSTYTWKNSSNVQVYYSTTTSTYGTSVPGTYTVTVTKTNVLGSAVSNSYTLVSQMAGQNANYIISNSALFATSDTSRFHYVPVDSISQTIQYFDGLGRQVQTVVTQGSPSRLDIVQPQVYDQYGREPKKYLPYTYSANMGASNGWMKPDPVGVISGNYASSQQFTFYVTAADQIPDDPLPYAETIFESSPLNRPLQDYGPGAGWRMPIASTDKFVQHQYLVNSHGTSASQEKIIAWTISADMPVRLTSYNSGYYPTGTLVVKSTKDENGNEMREYVDITGLTILKKTYVQGTTTDFITVGNWAETYYIYDDYNNLRYTFQPELSKTLAASSTLNPTSADLGKFAFVYKYDSRLRQVVKKVPSADSVFTVYDARDRIVMTQDGNQRQTGQWIFIKYDFLNRQVMTGQFASSNTRLQMQSAVNSFYTTNPNNWGEAGGSIVHNYTNNSYPSVSDANAYLTASYYDDYSVATSWGSSYNYVNDGLTGNGYSQPATSSVNTQGLIVEAKVKVLSTGVWLKNVTYYDEKHRVIQTLSDHPKGTARSSTLMDFPGRTLTSKRTYVVNSVSNNVTEVFTYDHGSRLTKTTHSVNGAAPITAAQTKYNELGQPIEKNLHSTDGVNYMQSVDYLYNIRGWMTNINQSDISAIASGDVTKDFFGMELAYNQLFSGLTTGVSAAWNGNISSTKWSHSGNKQEAYTFAYDALNRLLNADHYDSDSLGHPGVWASHWRGYGERGVAYDLNGNILSLKRYKYSGQFAYCGSMMDNLTYGYSGNQLSYVHDTGDATFGFINGNTGTDDYTYDVNGNLTFDKNKGIQNLAMYSRNPIQYNYLNLPKLVYKSNSDSIAYTYDASGHKWMQQVYGTNAKTTDYVGELVYEGGVLKFIQTSEGRVLPDGPAWEYQYYLKDHLGNVHITFTSKTQTSTSYIAGFETANQTTESNNFNPSYATSHINTVSTNANSGSNSYYLNGGYSGQVGIAKNFSVMPGDVVNIQAYAKYSTPSGTPSSYTSFVSALLSAFSLSAPLPGETRTPSSGINTFGGWEMGPNGDENKSDAMKVFVTIILFDRNYNFIDVAYGSSSASGALMSASYTVTEPGYAYLYISNEHPYLTDVYFDDVTMTLTPSQIVSASDYTPFGLSYRNGERQGSWEQTTLYSSKELQNELALNWYDFGARMYMPEIGRWGVVDPLAEKARKWSPYVYANDNPARFIDPDGMETTTLTGDAASYFVGALGRNASMSDDQAESTSEFFNNTSGGDHITSNQSSGGSSLTRPVALAMVRALGMANVENQGQAQGNSKNLIVSFIGYDEEIDETWIKKSGWELVRAKNLGDALAQINDMTKAGNNINNMVLWAHGNASEIHFGNVEKGGGGDNLSTQELRREGSQILKNFNSILNRASGAVVIYGCSAGQVLGKELPSYVDNTNVFINSDQSRSGRTLSTWKAYPPMENSGLTKVYNYGWHNIGTGAYYRDIILRMNGTISLVKPPY